MERGGGPRSPTLPPSSAAHKRQAVEQAVDERGLLRATTVHADGDEDVAVSPLADRVPSVGLLDRRAPVRVAEERVIAPRAVVTAGQGPDNLRSIDGRGGNQ